MSGDTSNVGISRHKPSVVQFPKSSLSDELLVDHSDEQLVVGSKPRPQLSVAIAATRNVAQTEIEAALEDVASEVAHTRAIAGHGFASLDELERDPVTIPDAYERADAEKLLTLALDALDDAEVSYHVRTALSKLQAREASHGGGGR